MSHEGGVRRESVALHHEVPLQLFVVHHVRVRSSKEFRRVKRQGGIARH